MGRGGSVDGRNGKEKEVTKLIVIINVMLEGRVGMWALKKCVGGSGEGSNGKEN